jgi:hypothetical protein
VEQIPARVEERPVNGGAGGTVIDLTSDTQMKKKKKKKKKKEKGKINKTRMEERS